MVRKVLFLGFLALLQCVLVSPAALAKKGREKGAAGGPKLVQFRDFVRATQNLGVVLDGLARFTPGFQNSQTLVLFNGVYTAPSPFIRYLTPEEAVLVSDTFGTFVSDAILSGNDVREPRTFSSFPAGTTYWGASLVCSSGAEFDITVVGRSGTQTFTAVRGNSLNGFLGVHDPRGLISISIKAVPFGSSGGSTIGVGNYSFDNIMTAAE